MFVHEFRHVLFSNISGRNLAGILSDFLLEYFIGFHFEILLKISIEILPAIAPEVSPDMHISKNLFKRCNFGRFFSWRFGNSFGDSYICSSMIFFKKLGKVSTDYFKKNYC